MRWGKLPLPSETPKFGDGMHGNTSASVTLNFLSSAADFRLLPSFLPSFSLAAHYISRSTLAARPLFTLRGSRDGSSEAKVESVGRACGTEGRLRSRAGIKKCAGLSTTALYLPCCVMWRMLHQQNDTSFVVQTWANVPQIS